MSSTDLSSVSSGTRNVSVSVTPEQHYATVYAMASEAEELADRLKAAHGEFVNAPDNAWVGPASDVVSVMRSITHLLPAFDALVAEAQACAVVHRVEINGPHAAAIVVMLARGLAFVGEGLGYRGDLPEFEGAQGWHFELRDRASRVAEDVALLERLGWNVHRDDEDVVRLDMTATDLLAIARRLQEAADSAALNDRQDEVRRFASASRAVARLAAALPIDQ